MTDRVTLDVQDHIAVVTLNRPAKYNAFDRAMFDAVSATGIELAERTDVRVVILRGAGGNFSAGLDISNMGNDDESLEDFSREAYELLHGTPANRFQLPAWVWFALPMPVIAAIDGVCFGAGVQVAAGADIRLADQQARLSIMEIKWGLVPDMAFTAALRDVMRLDHLKQLAYTGRIVSALEAHAYGLVSECSDDVHAQALGLATEIAGRSPDAVRATKQLLQRAWRQTLADGLRTEARLQDALMHQPQQIEATMANLEKRAPDFGDARLDARALLDSD